MGGKSGGTTQTTQTNAPPPNVSAAYNQAIGAATNASSAPLQQYQGPIVAGFTQPQTQAFNTINNLQGVQQPYLNNAQNLINSSTQPIWNQIQQPTAANIAQYQNPYTQQVIDSTMAQLNQNDAVQQQQLTGNAASSGAWGGDRSAVAQSLLANQQDLANNQTIAGLRNQSYSQALGEANTQQQQQLAATEAQNYLGQQGAFAENTLGNSALSGGLQGASAQLQTGGLQQQLAQEALNVPYQEYLQQQAYPFQTAQYFSNIAEGIGGASGGTATTSVPAPNSASQIAGLGLGGLSLVGGALTGAKDGGRISGLRHFDNGGSTLNLPPVPNVDASFIPLSGGGGGGGNTMPRGTNGTSSTTNSGLNIGSLSGLAGAGKGLNSLYNGAVSLFSGPSIAGDLGLAASSADVPAYGASIFSALDAAGADAGAAALSDAAFSDFLDALVFAKDGGRIGGLKKYASGGSTTPSPVTPYTGGTIEGMNPNEQGILNSIYGNNGPTYQTGLKPSVPSALAAPPAPAPSATASTPSATNNPAYTMFQGLSTNSLSPEQLSQMTDAYTQANGYSLTNAPYFYEGYVNQQGWKRGGFVRGYDDGGAVTPFEQTANPMQNNVASQYSQMSVQQLQQMAQRIPPTSPQRQVIQKVLQQKQMMPNVGAPAPSNAPPQGFKRGGVAEDDEPDMYPLPPNVDKKPTDDGEPDMKYADGGTAITDIFDPDHEGEGVLPSILEQQNVQDVPMAPPVAGVGERPMRSSTMPDAPPVQEAMAEPQAGLSAPQSTKELGFQKPDPWLSLAAAGFGMAAGNSPYALQNVGAGALEGIKNYGEQKKLAAEQQGKQAEIGVKNRSAELDAQKLQNEADWHKVMIGVEQENADTNRMRAGQENVGIVPDGMGGFLKYNKKTGDTTAIAPPASIDPPMGPDGKPISGDTYLKTLPPHIAALAKKVADGDVPWPSGYQATKGVWPQVITAATQYDPQANAGRYPAVQKFNTGKQGDTTRYFDVAAAHLDTLDKLSDALQNGDTKGINALNQTFKEQFGQPAPTNFDAAKQIVANEVIKAVTGAGGGVEDRKNAQDEVNRKNSPAQLKGVIQTYKTLVNGQLGGLEQQYIASTGRKDYREKYLTPQARASLESAANPVLTTPPDMASRKIGQVYPTPKGPKVWTAAGWDNPPTGTQ